jgi:hypothetical protein
MGSRKMIISRHAATRVQGGAMKPYGQVARIVRGTVYFPALLGHTVMLSGGPLRQRAVICATSFSNRTKTVSGLAALIDTVTNRELSSTTHLQYSPQCDGDLFKINVPNLFTFAVQLSRIMTVHIWSNNQ